MTSASPPALASAPRAWFPTPQERADIALEVRRVRRAAGYSQRAVAALLGVTASAVGQWETGRALPSVHLYLRLLALPPAERIPAPQEGRAHG